MKNIPKYIQVLNKSHPEDNNLKIHLQKAYDLGGVIIDDEMKKSNPNAQREVMCIPTREPKVLDSGNVEMPKQGHMTNWVYCGDFWYVRKVDGQYDFAQYLAYNTESRQVEGLWDKERYEGLNKCST